MDTDSSLPPLLFLAASLLIYSWASIVATVRRQPPAFALLLAEPRSPAIRVLRAAASATAGVSALGIAWALAPGWPVVVLLIGAIVPTAVALAGLHLVSERWAMLFPNAARRLARPARWLAATGPVSANGDTPAANGVNGQSALHDARNHDPSRAPADPPPLTPAEIMNLDYHDIHMVRSISRMDDRDVKDIMVPSLDVDAVSVSATLRELVGVLVSTKHSRLPVYRGTMDHVVGVIHISDVLLALTNEPAGVSLDSIMREPEFVAENMAVDDLLHLMREKSLQMAIVVDEYGGVEGIVTLEDVLEEIVGDIEDEFDSGDEFTADGDGAWLVNATMPVAELAAAVGIDLDYGDVNTIGGYVYTRLGRMPAVGDVVTADDLTIEVTQVRGRRIQQLRLAAGAGGDVPASEQRGSAAAT